MSILNVHDRLGRFSEFQSLLWKNKDWVGIEEGSNYFINGKKDSRQKAIQPLKSCRFFDYVRALTPMLFQVDFLGTSSEISKNGFHGALEEDSNYIKNIGSGSHR